MERTVRAILTVLTVSALAMARNAADLKAELQTILPTGTKKVRLAWIKGGSFSEFPFNATTTVVYVVDSDDGVIRRLHPVSGSGTFFNVNITTDGSKVLFYNKDTGRLGVINWDGSNYREVSVGGTAIEYWRNPADGTDWSIVYVNDMSRVRIDQPSSRVRIGAPGIAGNGGGGLSDDGAKLVGYCYQGCTGGPFGIVTTATNQWKMGPHGGCWSSMSAGSTPRYNHNPSGHSQMCVHDATDQTKFTVYPISEKFQQFLTEKGLKGTCYQWPTNEGSRFTQHPDFATFMSGKSTVNPVLVRLSDMRFVYIEDNLPCTFCGDMDAVFLNSAVGVRTQASVRPMTSPAQNLAGAETYLPDGRRLDPAQTHATKRRGSPVKGVVIRRIQETGFAGHAVVLLQ